MRPMFPARVNSIVACEIDRKLCKVSVVKEVVRPATRYRSRASTCKI
jgi:hypothetical protein